MTVAASLWVFAVLLWIILIYTFFASVTVAEPKPSLEVAINGSWLLVSWEVLHDFQPFIGGFTLFFWATGTWRIPLLVIVGFWRHVVERVPVTYYPHYWSLVFPLGMYTVATSVCANATGGDFTKGKIKHGKDSVTLGNDERSARPSGKRNPLLDAPRIDPGGHLMCWST